jgi:hypothetical protein
MVLEKSLDQFFTSEKLSLYCLENLNEYLKTCTFSEPLVFVEPSAGSGSFYNLLPQKQRIGFEIDKNLCQGTDLHNCDFLSVRALPNNCSLIAVGNPPFSLGDGKLCTRKKNIQAKFIQHCANLGCNVIGFIVGANMHRFKAHQTLKNLKLVKSTFLPQTKFGAKKFNVYFDIYIKSETVSSFPKLDEIKPIEFSLINSDLQYYDLCFIRWGSNCTKIVTHPHIKPGLTRTQSRYFFVLFRSINLETFQLFLDYVKNYIYTVSTISSGSLSIYEIYFLFRQFKNNASSSS